MIEFYSFMIGLGVGTLIIGIVAMASKHHYEKIIKQRGGEDD